LEAVVQSLFDRYARKYSSALLCAAAIIVAGCHNNDQNSGYGLGWVTLTDTPGDFTSYTVNVDSVTLTGVTYGVITAVATPETVDFTKLDNIAELWSTASIPNDTYTSASIVLDYTTANVSVMVNGVPQKAKVVDTTGAAVTTMTINVTLDTKNQLTIVPTLSSSSAVRLAIDFDLAASNVVNLATSPATVTVKPFMTAATSASDTKPVRVRGPLINSSAAINTFTVEVRPFFDEINSLGLLTIFGDDKTVYQINGVTSVGAPGITQLSQSSAGTTVAAAYTTYTPTATLNPAVTAAKFNANYVVAGSTLEDFYTQGLEGDVIARSGNTLTLRGSTLQLNDGSSQYNDADAVVLLGPATIVTAEDNTTLKGLDYKSVAVGQHIIARGIYELPASGVVTLDSTGSSSTNTGSVRMQSTQLWGSLVSSASGTVTMDLQTIDNWPVSNYKFAGNGASAVVPASYEVNEGAAALPAGVLDGDPVWIDGVTTAFGSAPPDFNAFTINSEVSVPARLQVDWTSAGTITPFTTATSTELTIDLGDPHFSAGVIRIGSESIALNALPETPRIVPQATPAATPGLPAVFLPLFSIGNLSAADTTTITEFNVFSDFVTQLPKSLVAATPALHLVATGTYNRAGNTFTASSIDVVN
jgi:sulfur transfer complex TusBCD TusB component (DsrH family)